MNMSPCNSALPVSLSLGLLLLSTSCKTEVSYSFPCEYAVLHLTKQEKNFLGERRKKLEDTVFPLISMDDVTILEAIFWLSCETQWGMSFIQQSRDGKLNKLENPSDEELFEDKFFFPTFSVRLSNVNVLEALDYMCQRAGCVWHMNETGRIYVSNSREFFQRNDNNLYEAQRDVYRME